MSPEVTGSRKVPAPRAGRHRAFFSIPANRVGRSAAVPDEATEPDDAGRVTRLPRRRAPADTAYRRAWWVLGLYPFTFVAAFLVGEGLFSWLDDGVGDPAGWVMFVSATPAIAVFVIPGVLAVVLGRRAIRLGRPDGSVPAIVGATIALGFIGLNLASYVLQVLFG